MSNTIAHTNRYIELVKAQKVHFILIAQQYKNEYLQIEVLVA